MESRIDKYLLRKALENIAFQKKLNKLCVDELLKVTEKTLIELETAPSEGDADWAINYVEKYIQIFSEQVNLGHSYEWSSTFANEVFDYQDELARAFAFDAIFEKDEEKAISDLRIFCNQINADELFTKQFIYLMQEGIGHEEPNAEEQAHNYCVIFREQIKKGKSEIFAHRYADLSSCKYYTDIYCFAYAIEFEKLIIEGFSEEFASTFATNIAEYIANHFDTYEKSINDKLVIIEKNSLKEKLKQLM